MGCDIHAHFEIKVNGKWEHYNITKIKRNYHLFTKMAGVRRWNDEIKQISDLKGIPKDVSNVTKIFLNYWKDDGHSYSWFNAQEIKELIKWWERNIADSPWKIHHEEIGYLFNNTFSGFIDYPNEYPKEIEDLRLIFWFDN